MNPDITLIVGLGNPGKQYERTRHNIGFLALDALFSEAQAGHQNSFQVESVSLSGWREKFGALCAEICLGEERLLLQKPLSFMNLSGTPVAEFSRFFKIPPSKIIVVHDDIDLPFGSMRIRQGGGDGGHNGVRSLCATLGDPGFIRVRLGVGRPSAQTPGPAVSDWVLGRFSKEEELSLPSILDRTILALREICQSGLKKAQNLFNETS